MARQRQSRERATLRIIGGSWRGRKLSFPEIDGLRPTADRVRETVFNWLQPITPGARCLDLFAGSGALGLEALSRGASHCDFIEHNTAAASAIKRHIAELGCGDRGTVISADALTWRSDTPYDLVFIDPPFDANYFDAALMQVSDADLLADDGRIYLELPVSQSMPDIEQTFEHLKAKTAGNVQFHLLGGLPS